MSLTNASPSPSNDKIQSFLESLRASRESHPQQNPFKEIQIKKEIEKSRIESFHQARQKEWGSVFSAKERGVSEKIESLRLQLKALAKQVKVLDTNIAKALGNPMVEAGIYHENYLNHIQKVIHLLSQSVNSTNTWLQMYSDRSNKKGYYWQMAGSKGSSFTQNNERTVATSIG